MKSIKELEKEIKELEIERAKYDDRGMFNADRDVIDLKLTPLKFQLKQTKEICKLIEEDTLYPNTFGTKIVNKIK